jgi:hypothetical protein
MSGTFGKFILPSLFASGAVFAVLAVPLAVYGSEKVDVQLSDSIGVTGTVQDFTAPYLGLSGLASFAIGGATATGLSVVASRKQAQLAEKQYLEAQANFQHRERQLQEALLSESSLVKSGLSFFLDETQTEPQVSPSFPGAQGAIQVVPLAQSMVAPAIVNAEVPTPQSQIGPLTQPVVASVAPGFTVNASNVSVQPVKVPRVTAQVATSPLHAAHGFMSFARGGQVVPPAAIAWAEERTSVMQPTQQLEVLQGQLQDLMLQIETLQVSLQTKAVAETHGAHTYSTHIEVIQEPRPLVPASAHRFQPFEHSWASVPQRVAS